MERWLAHGEAVCCKYAVARLHLQCLLTDQAVVVADTATKLEGEAAVRWALSNLLAQRESSYTIFNYHVDNICTVQLQGNVPLPVNLVR